MSSAITAKKPDKISGYDRYEVEEAVRTMKRADEVKADPKFLAVVIKEMDKESDKLDESAKLLKKVGKKLKAIREDGKN